MRSRLSVCKVSSFRLEQFRCGARCPRVCAPLPGLHFLRPDDPAAQGSGDSSWWKGHGKEQSWLIIKFCFPIPGLQLFPLCKECQGARQNDNMGVFFFLGGGGGGGGGGGEGGVCPGAVQ